VQTTIFIPLKVKVVNTSTLSRSNSTLRIELQIW